MNFIFSNLSMMLTIIRWSRVKDLSMKKNNKNAPHLNQRKINSFFTSFQKDIKFGQPYVLFQPI